MCLSVWVFEGREVCAFVSWWTVEIWVRSVSSFSPHACNALYFQPGFTTRFVTDKMHSFSLYNTDFNMSSSVCQYMCTLTHSMYIRIQLMGAERLHLENHSTVHAPSNYSGKRILSWCATARLECTLSSALPTALYTCITL